MIKEALQYIVGLGKAEEHIINGACQNIPRVWLHGESPNRTVLRKYG